MKYLKHIFLATALMFTTLSANAMLIKQDVFLNDIFVDEDQLGSAFNVDPTLVGPVFLGTVQYHIDNVLPGGIISASDDPFFSFDLSLGDFAITEADDIDFGGLGPLAFTADLFDFSLGLVGLETFVDFDGDGLDDGSIFDDSFLFFDEFGLELSGFVSFDNTRELPEPSVLAMLALGLLAMSRRKVLRK